MFSKIKDRNIWVIYEAILLVGIAYGIAVSLIAHHLDARGFTKSEMGSLASVFALGVVGLSIPMGKAIRRWSAKSTLVLCLAGYAVTVSVFPALTSHAGVMVDRLLDGALSVGVWVSCETVLLARAPRAAKAYVMSLYAVAIALGYVVGPLVAEGVVHVATIPLAFLVSGALAAAATVLVVLRLDPRLPAGEEPSADDPRHAADSSAPISSLKLLGRIKTSCFATFAYGYFQASVVLFLPLYLVESKGVSRDRTILVTFFFALGMLLCSNAAGRLGDRYGYLFVMRLLGAVGMCMVLGFIVLSTFATMAVAVFVAGATLATISPVSLALQGAIAAPQDYSRSNAIYNAFYAAGMLVGPKVSSVIFDRQGGGVMLLHLAALWAAFVVFTAVFRRDDPTAAKGWAKRGATADAVGDVVS